MTDYFDFESTENFLDSISGTLNSTSPSSVSDNDIQLINEGKPYIWNDGILQQTQNPYNFDNTGNIGNGGENEFFNELFQANNIELNPTVMSSNDSQSRGSSITGTTPFSNPSIESNHPSPEVATAIKKDIAEDPKLHEVNKKGSKITKPGKKDKNSHNMIEKKYRTNINSKILALRDAVPALRIAAGKHDVSLADLEGLTPASKLNKASVLTKATEYIRHLEKKNELLKNQNLQLQQLIQEANIYPPQTQQLRQRISPSGTQSPNEFNYNNIPNYQDMQSTQEVQNPGYEPSRMNKYLMGGMATMVGTSLFSGTDNDFRGLSSLPIINLLPSTILEPSPLSIEVWRICKIILILVSLFSLISPSYYSNDAKNEKQRSNRNVWKSWSLTSLGLQLPEQLSEGEKLKIINRLMGKSQTSFFSLLEDYLLLSASEITFEVCFLTVLTGVMIISQRPLFKNILHRNLSIKSSLLLNLVYDGDDESLKRLSKLIHGSDSLAVFGSRSLISRLNNISLCQSVNNEIFDGPNRLKYVESYLASRNNYYGIIVEWRVLEIIQQLNVKYLKEMIDGSEDIGKTEKISTQLDNLSYLISRNSRNFNDYMLLKTVIDFQNYPVLFSTLKTQTLNRLNNFKIIVNGQDLTDNEISNTSDEEGDNSDHSENELKIIEKVPLKSQKSLISSLNIVSDEQVIVLSCSAVIYYYKNSKSDLAVQLLKHLKFKDVNKLSLLSFTSLLSLINYLVPGVEDSDVLDNLVKLLSKWIKEKDLSSSMSFEMRSSLSDLVVTKGMILSDIETVVDEE